jgi:hypothetical protein
MIRSFNPEKRGGFAPYMATLALSVLLTACSTPQAPNEALQAAELAIATAEQARVADYASPELGLARDKLTAAREAVIKEEMVSAARLAEQARADAELASAKAEAAKAQEVNDELGKNINTLEQELQRNSGEVQ